MFTDQIIRREIGSGPSHVTPPDQHITTKCAWSVQRGGLPRLGAGVARPLKCADRYPPEARRTSAAVKPAALFVAYRVASRRFIAGQGEGSLWLTRCVGWSSGAVNPPIR
jgi:hypothetical protein